MPDLRTVTCGHEETLYRVRDNDGEESVSCISCLSEELALMPAGVVVTWTIERLPHDPEPSENEDDTDASDLVDPARGYGERPPA